MTSTAFIYNSTIKVSHAVHEVWLKWLKEKYIPQIMDAGCFDSYRILRLLNVDDTDGPTYALQFTAQSRGALQRFETEYQPEFAALAFAAWGDQFVAFNTIMQVVD